MVPNFIISTVFSIVSFCILLSLPSIAMDTEEHHRKFRSVVKNLKQSSMEEKNSPSSTSSSRLNRFEGLLFDNIEKMQKERQFVQELDKEVDLYTCDSHTFDEFFPVWKDENFESFCVGQIQIKEGRTCATGTLVFMEQGENKEINFKCITALHVFVGRNKDHGLFIKQEREFVLGRKESDTMKDKVYNLGTSSIEKVKVLKKPRDICLFEGKFVPNPDVFSSNEDFLVEFKDHLPKISQDLSVEQVDTHMYHYPLGTKSQRKNTGPAFVNNRTHKMESVYGSSGAALLNESLEIFGIHTGCGSISDNKIAAYGKRKIPITDFNTFELFFQKDYDDLVNGIDIYGVPFHTLPNDFKSALSTIVEDSLKQ